MKNVLAATLLLLMLTPPAWAGLWRFDVTKVSPPPAPPDYGLEPPAIHPGPTLLVLDLGAEGGQWDAGACFGERGQFVALPAKGFCGPGTEWSAPPILATYDLRPDGDGGWLGSLFVDLFGGDNQFTLARASGDPVWSGRWGYDNLGNVCSLNPQQCPIEGVWRRVAGPGARGGPASVPGPSPLALIAVGLAALGLTARRRYVSSRSLEWRSSRNPRPPRSGPPCP